MPRQPSRLLNSVEGGVGRLLDNGILPGSLPELRGRRCLIKKVVGNLKGEANLLTVKSERRQFILRCAAN